MGDRVKGLGRCHSGGETRMPRTDKRKKVAAKPRSGRRAGQDAAGAPYLRANRPAHHTPPANAQVLHFDGLPAIPDLLHKRTKTTSAGTRRGKLQWRTDHRMGLH
jgi:hypothetical protein